MFPKQWRSRCFAGELEGKNIGVLTIAADMTLPNTPALIIKQTKERFGGIGILINNAGTGLNSPFAETTPE